MRIFGAYFSAGCADSGCGFLADFLQKAPNRRTVHFSKSHKIHSQNPATIPDPRGSFWKEAERWSARQGIWSQLLGGTTVGALGLDKVAGLGCSSVPVLCLYYSLCFKFCDFRQWNIPSSQKIRKNSPGPKSIQELFSGKQWHHRLHDNIRLNLFPGEADYATRSITEWALLLWTTTSWMQWPTTLWPKAKDIPYSLYVRLFQHKIW